MTQISQSAYWLTLTYASGLRLTRVKAIVADWCLRCGHPLSDLFELSPADMAARLGLTGEECEAIQTARGHVSRQAVWASDLASKGVHIVTRTAPSYPVALTCCLPLSQQPLLLFFRGDPGMLYQPLVALVGMPDASQAVIESTGELAALLAGEGLVVVSGLSSGVGRASFDGALSTTDGQAVAVLPMGICALDHGQEAADTVERNRALFLSPFHPDAPINESRARARNRLMAAMVDALIVMTTSQEGLTREMAEEALVMGKGVYVWDFGSAAEPASAGNQALIEAGAMSTSSLSHVLDLMQAVVEASLEQQATQESSPAMSPHHPTDATAVPLEPMDSQTTLDLLSKAGRVPAALINRLEKI